MKIYLYIEEGPYRKGVENYLELTKGLNKNIHLIDSLSEIKEGEKSLVLTDSQESEGLKNKNITIYRLTNQSDETKDSFCKYNSFENILHRLVKLSEEREEKKDFELVCISSIREGAGKTLIAGEAALILSESRPCCLIELYPSEPGEDKDGNRLDELLLGSMNGAKPELKISDEGYYKIQGFRLIEDYVELDCTHFQNLLRDMNEELGIELFIVELKHFLDNTSRELIKIAATNLLIVEEELEDYDAKEIYYIEGLSSKKGRFKRIKNKVKRLKSQDELPYIYKLEEDEESIDKRHFRNSLKRLLEEV